MVTEIVIQVTVGTQTITILTLDWNLLGPSDTQPTPTSGFAVASTPIEIDGTKYWIEYRTVEP